MKNPVLKQRQASAVASRIARMTALFSFALAAQMLGAQAKATKPTKPAPASNALTNAPVVFVVPQSEFVDDFKVGRDPFFPSSTRRHPKGAPPVPSQDPNPKGIFPPVALNPKAFLNMLTLKGISKGARGRKFAVISNYTFAPGESIYVRLGGATNRVKCEEIRDQKVVVSVEGLDEKRELFIKQAEVLDEKKTPDLKPK